MVKFLLNACMRPLAFASTQNPALAGFLLRACECDLTYREGRPVSKKYASIKTASQ